MNFVSVLSLLLCVATAVFVGRHRYRGEAL